MFFEAKKEENKIELAYYTIKKFLTGLKYSPEQ